MKRLAILVAAIVAASISAPAQVEVEDLTDRASTPLSNTTSITPVIEQDGTLKLVDKHYQVQYETYGLRPGKTHERLGRKGEYGFSHNRRTGSFKYISLAGVKVIVDQNDVPVQIVGCRNLIYYLPKTRTRTRTLVYERTKYVQIPGETRSVPVYIEKPVYRYVERVTYELAYVFGPSIMPSSPLEAPNSYYQTINLGSFGGSGGIKLTNSLSLGDIIAEAAAAAAAAASSSSSSSSTSTSPGAGAGSSGGSSGSSGSSGATDRGSGRGKGT
jgi:uncharacterized membrane protein YgcG